MSELIFQHAIQSGGLRVNKSASILDSDELLVSVVTVVLNGEKHLEKAIQSVICQSHSNIEYIIIDGCSSDRTVDIIRKYDDQIDYWVSEPDSGIYDAMNKGISFSRGALIKFINADDLLSVGSIEKAVQAYQSIEGRDRTIINSYLEVIDDKGESLEVWKNDKNGKRYPAFLHPSWYVPASVYRECGLYNLNYRISSDYDFYMKLIHNNCAVHTLEYPLAKFRVGGASSGFSGIFETYRINKKYNGTLYSVYALFLGLSAKLKSKAKIRLKEYCN